MSTFAQLAALPGVGVAYLVDVSADGFATTLKRWSTVDGFFGGADAYDARIISVGNLSKAFGAERAFTTSTIQLTVDNVDAGADDLMAIANYAAILSWEFRVKVALWNPSTPTDLALKTLGTFSLLDAPRRSAESIRLQLQDSTSAKVREALRAPSINDWVAITDGDRPQLTNGNFAPGIDLASPLPIRFGSRRHPLIRLFGSSETDHASTFILCARKTALPSRLSGVFMSNGADISSCVASFELYVNAAGVGQLGQVVANDGFCETPTITVDGESWTIVWLQIVPWRVGYFLREHPSAANGLADDIVAKLLDGAPAKGNPYASSNTATETAHAALDELGLHFTAGFLSESHDVADFGSAFMSPAALAYSIITGYTSLGTSGADKASFQRVAAGRNVSASGSITFDSSVSSKRGVELTRVTGSDILPAIDALGMLGGFELVTKADGKVYCSRLDEDFRAMSAEAPVLDETQVSDVEDRFPSKGERWEPLSRVYVERLGTTFGPYVNPEFSPLAGGSKVVRLEWYGDENEIEGERGFLSQEAESLAQFIFSGPDVRPIIFFTAFLDAVELELGDLFYMSWTRGGRGTPYTDVLWRVESWAMDPESATVRIEAVWCADLPDRELRPYLVDNEALLVRRTNATAGKTFTATTGSSTVTTNETNLITAGVVAGDILELTDSTETEGIFLRNRCLLISTVAATSIVFDTAYSDTSFGTGGPYTFTTWRILRGHKTFPTSAEDPTNYPSGGLPYGAVVDASDGNYSNDDVGHFLGA